MIKLTATDGGKAEAGFGRETRDCAVRAIALATNTPYAEAHAALKAQGRRDRRGAKMVWIAEALKEVATEVEDLTSGVIFGTLAQTIQKYPEGRYVVITTGHAQALINGTIHDTMQISGPRSRVKRVFRVVPKHTKEVPVDQIISQSQINDLWARLDALEARSR